MVDYEQIKRKYHISEYNRKCINGQIVGCARCVGYCRYDEHPGYLTKELMKEHKCFEKSCSYYVPKEVKKKAAGNPFYALKNKLNMQEEKILKAAKSLSVKYEGMSFIKADMKSTCTCELTYATVSNTYDLGVIVDKISKEFGVEVEIKRINCQYETAIKLISENND